MKKSVLSAITTALVVGAASTAFAASNPFADVPADHWAYDAVSQLAQDGIVDGYAADGSWPYLWAEHYPRLCAPYQAWRAAPCVD